MSTGTASPARFSRPVLIVAVVLAIVISGRLVLATVWNPFSGGRGSGVQIRISSPFAEKMEFPLGVKAADRTSRL